MASTLITGITHGSKSRISNPKLHPGFDEQYNYNDPRDRGGNNHHNVRVCIKQMVWGQHNPYISLIRRYSRFRFNIHFTHSWRSFLIRNSDKSSKSGTVSNRNRKRNRHYFYYGILISLLSVAPVRANEGETNNTSNPVAAATGLEVLFVSPSFAFTGAIERRLIRIP